MLECPVAADAYVLWYVHGNKADYYLISVGNYSM
jgi:hypothetical protein